jgi:glutamate dehydrogenase
MLSYAKLSIYDELLSSNVPDDPYMTGELQRYFPTAIQERFAAAIPEHRLRREIVATVLTNSIVNRTGITFVHEVRERTGMPTEEVARAYVVGREVFGLRELWDDIEALDNQVPAALQATMLAECGRTQERATVWFLRLPEGLSDIGALVDEYRDGVVEIAARFSELTTENEAELIEERAAGFHEMGAPLELAGRVALLQSLAPACDIVRLARSGDWPGRPVAEIYFAIGARFGFNWLRRAALRLPAESAWDKLAVNAIVDDLYGHQAELVRNVLESADPEGLSIDDIDSWVDDRRATVARTEMLIAELQSGANPSLAMLAVANRQLKSMCV